MNKAKVCQLIEQHRDAAVCAVQALTRFPSMMWQERTAQEHYAELLRAMSLTVDMWFPQPDDMAINPFFLGARDHYTGSPNVAARLKGVGGGRSMLLNGHIDVVPEGDNDWDSDPWSGEYRDGKVYGRGTSDMKGGLVANLMAVKAIMDAGITLKGDVILASVIGEETGGAGTLSLLSRGYTADGAIVPEPTDLHICPVSIGVMWFRTTVRGVATHAGTAHLGVNAITRTAAIIQALDTYDQERRFRPRHELYQDRPHPFNINMGVIRGGIFPTSVPDEVVLESRIAIAPDEDILQARREVEEVIFAAARQDTWLREHLPQVEWYGFCLTSGMVSTNHPLTQTLMNNYQHLTGASPVISGTPWGTDAGAMIRYGNIPTIVFGPGPGDTAHKANEYVDMDKLVTAAKVIAVTLLDWCEVAE